MQKKILVVDNHPIILKFMVDLLGKKGHQVLTADDGLSALEILKNFVPDMIFVDLIMPNIDGKKLCQIIRSRSEMDDCCLVIISALSIEDDLDYLGMGANACLAKGPFNIMAKNIHRVMDLVEKGDLKRIEDRILGFESIAPRIITHELISNKRHLEIILNSMSEGILEITAQGKIVYANPAVLTLINKDEENLLGSNFLQLFDVDSYSVIRTLLDQIQRNKKFVKAEMPLEMNNKLVEIKILFLEEGGQNSIVILHDLTEQKRKEAQFQQAQKMEAVGTLAAGIAHDFNNLLMGIIGNTSLMLMDTDRSHQNYKMLKSIEKQVRSGSKLTSQLLGYARKGQYELRFFSLNDLLQETAETFGRTKKEITIRLDLEKSLFSIQADQGQMEQVLLNLLVNAADAMHDGGELLLKTRNTTHDHIKGRHYVPEKGRYVLFMIVDTGIGMDERILDRIFDPFFTTKSRSKSTGLGLASVYGIIKGHNGYINVESKKGHGTTFKIYLPAKEIEAQKEADDPEENKTILKGSEKILLVDDEEMIRDVAKTMLEMMSYNVLLARNGEEALKVYGENGNAIDLVLLDMVMPKLGGGKTYDRLKTINPDIKVVLSSGYSIDGEAQEIINRGCNGFIQKPFTLKELSSKVREVLDSGKGGRSLPYS